MKNSDLPQNEQWQLLTDTIANEENAYSIEFIFWKGSCFYPKDSFQGECGTPASVLGWGIYLGLEIGIPYSISLPVPENSNAIFSYYDRPEWFTRAKAVAMLKHYVETAKWDGDGNMLEYGYGKVDWRLDEREIV